MSQPRQQREMVYCHMCEHEWYKDEQGLSPCPRCGNQITEIIDEDNDPRASNLPDDDDDDDDDDRLGTANLGYLRRHNPWSSEDPDEDDIDDIPFGSARDHLFHHRPLLDANRGHIFPPPPHPFFLRAQPAPPRMATPGNNHNPLAHNFVDMLNGMGGPQTFASAWAQSTRPSHRGGPAAQQPRRRASSPSDAGPGRPHIEIYAQSSNLNAPITIRNTSRQINSPDPNDRGAPMQFNELHELLSHIFNGMPNAVPGDGSHPNNNNGSNRRGTDNLWGGPPQDGGSAILGLLGSAMTQAMGGGRGTFTTTFHGDHGGPTGPLGDFVFSDEALDRVMSQLMEQHQSGAAPPPASQTAIRALPKKGATKKELGDDGKADCSICMVEVALGDEVNTLPCGHWFHPECVGHWLSEHDTCPVCRAGIMPKEGDRNSVRASGQVPLHDESPVSVARRQRNTLSGRGTGTFDNPIVVQESPSADRRRPAGGPGASRRSSGQGAGRNQRSRQPSSGMRGGAVNESGSDGGSSGGSGVGGGGGGGGGFAGSVRRLFGGSSGAGSGSGSGGGAWRR